MGNAARLAEATDFAARAHVDQRRKGHRAEPYINHLTDVAARLGRSEHGEDTDLLLAGMLHDTIEDTEVDRAELANRFGEAVATLVMEVTDDNSLPKSERKRLQIAHAASASERARMIKLADKASNLMSLVTSPPQEWNRERLSEYVDWSEAVCAGCRGVDQSLEDEFDAAVALARRSIAEHHPITEDAQ